MSKSTILVLQEVLFKDTDANIITKISKYQTTITASNISEDSFAILTFIANNPIYNSSLSLIDIQVYLEDDRDSIHIPGLYNIVLAKIGVSDVEAFISDKKSHQPFIDGFQDGRSIGQLVDTLSSLSQTTPDTVGKIKKYVIIMNSSPNSVLMSSSNSSPDSSSGWDGPTNPYPNEPNTGGPTTNQL